MADALMQFDTQIDSEKDYRSKLKDLSRNKKRERADGYWEIRDGIVLLSCDKGKYELKFRGQQLIELRNYRFVNGRDVKHFVLSFPSSKARVDTAKLQQFNSEGNEFDGSISEVKKIEFREKKQSVGKKVTYVKINLRKFGTIRYSFAGSRLLHLSSNLRPIKPEYISLRKEGELLWKENFLPIKKFAMVFTVLLFACAGGAYAFRETQENSSQKAQKDIAQVVKSQEELTEMESESNNEMNGIKKQLQLLRTELENNKKHIVALKRENRRLKINKRKTVVRREVKTAPVPVLKAANGEEGIIYYKSIDDAPQGAELFYNKRSKEFIDINQVPKIYRSRFLTNPGLYEKVDPDKISVIE